MLSFTEVHFLRDFLLRMIDPTSFIMSVIFGFLGELECGGKEEIAHDECLDTNQLLYLGKSGFLLIPALSFLYSLWYLASRSQVLCQPSRPLKHSLLEMLFLLMQLNACHFRFPTPLILNMGFWVFSPLFGVLAGCKEPRITPCQLFSIILVTILSL